MTDFVSKELFRESMKNVNDKLDHIFNGQDKTLKKIEELALAQSVNNEQIVKLTINDAYKNDQIVLLSSEINSVKNKLSEQDKIIGQFQSDKRWIAVIVGSGWTITIGLVHVYIKYKLGIN